MKLNARDLKSTLHWNIITSVRKSSGQARAITMSARTSRRCCNTSSVSRVSHTRLWLRARRDLKVVRTRSHRGRLGRRRTFCRHGACLQRLRSLAAGFSQARSSEQLFRWCIRQRCAVSCTQPGVAARVVGTARKSETGWCAVQLKSARS